jgi:alkylated DNA repair protein alkB family protein 8
MAPEDPEAPKVYQRYCHVYKEGELETLFDHLGSWVRVNRVYFDCGNWCVEAERIA